jgi:hypothetical protein
MTNQEIIGRLENIRLLMNQANNQELSEWMLMINDLITDISLN